MKALGLGCIAPNYRLVLQIKLQLSLTQGIALDEHLPEKPQYSSSGDAKNSTYGIVDVLLRRCHT